MVLARERPKAPLCKGSCQKSSDFRLRDCYRSAILHWLSTRIDTYRTIPPSRLRRATSLYTREALVRCKLLAKFKLSNRLKTIIVGASIARPCGTFFVFAVTQCEIVTVYSTDGQWPPLHFCLNFHFSNSCRSSAVALW